MMDAAHHQSLVWIILAAAVATFATRIGGYLLISRFKRLHPRVEAALNAVPAAVLATLVAPAVVYGGWDTAIAMVVAFFVGLRASTLWMLLVGWLVVMGIRAATGF